MAAPPELPECAPGAQQAGLCARCAHARVQQSARGSRFWRCARADTDPALRRYPQLPVTACPGYEPLPAPNAAAPGDASSS